MKLYQEMVARVGSRHRNIDRALVEATADLAPSEADIAPISLPVIEFREKHGGGRIAGLFPPQGAEKLMQMVRNCASLGILERWSGGWPVRP